MLEVVPAAALTVHRIMDTEHGLGSVTGEMMLYTLLNHSIWFYGTSNTVRTDPEGAFRDQGLRKQECLGRPLTPSNSQQYVWLEELQTVSQFKTSLLTALQVTMTYIETVDSLRDSCCWEEHRQTHRFV